MIKNINNSAQPVDRASNIVYEYLLQCVTTKSPPEVIQEFKNLLIQGRNVDQRASKAFEKIISSAEGQQFNTILSYCFYLILDNWSHTPKSLSYLAQLWEILDLVDQTKSYDRRRLQLIQLIKDHQRSPAYFQLKAIMAIIDPQAVNNIISANAAMTNEESNHNNSINTSIINTYLPRYTYLYNYFLPQEFELNYLRKYLQALQENRQKNFEIQLSKHIIYRFRLQQVAKMKLLSKGAGKIITKVNNPSLLSEPAFRIALQQYLGVDRGSTILQRSQRFVIDNNSRSSFQVFKQDLHRFLTNNIKPRNSNYNFSQELKQKLDDAFFQSDRKPLNDTLILQTCRQLYSFLITDTHSATDPNKLANLIVNLGTAQVMIILIKIVLICPESKSDLEKKIALIASYYQLNAIQEIPWLFKTLEHLLVAFSIYFGKIDVSIAKSVVAE